VNASDLATGLAELDALSTKALGLRWEEAFGSQPPIDCRPALLRRALAWHIQASANGRVNVDRLLRITHSPKALMPGTRLVREWQGKTHQVMVQPNRFEFEGRSYRSLSAIARAITGTAWSGPLFFGLK
jgi:hypothetical protein